MIVTWLYSFALALSICFGIWGGFGCSFVGFSGFFTSNYSIIQDSVLNVGCRVSGYKELHCQLLDYYSALPVQLLTYISIFF